MTPTILLAMRIPMLDTDDDDDGTKLMVCVGQTPEDPTSVPMNLFLVSPES